MEPIFTRPDLPRYSRRPFTPDDWRDCGVYLYDIDLFNHGYWWEAHEALEAVWLAAGQQSTVCGIFVQGLIQLVGEPQGAQLLTTAGCTKLALVDGSYLGIEVATFTADAKRCLDENRDEFPRIELHF